MLALELRQPGLEVAMKNILLVSLAGFLGVGMMALGQTRSPATPQVLGRGRGGAPYAWNDKNKDGICDITGKPVGQGRGAALARSGCRDRSGRGPGWGRGGRGRGRGMGRGYTPPGAQTAPTQPLK